MNKLIFIALSCFLNFSAIASIMKLEVEGIVTQVDPIFIGLVDIGDPMSAKFTYDPTKILYAYDFDVGRAFHYLEYLEYEISFGVIKATGLGGRIETTDNYIDSYGRLWDRYIVQHGGAGSLSIPKLEGLFDVNVLAAGIILYDYSDANALSSSDLLNSLDLRKFDINNSHVTIQMDIDNGDFDWLPIFARVTNAELVAVPEPTSVSILALGLLGLASRRKLRYR